MAPAGFEEVVLGLQKAGTVTDPVSTVRAMAKRGYSPKTESGSPRDPVALYRRLQHDQKQEESIAASTLGAVMRKGVEGSYFADCPRDEKGRCAPGGGGASSGGDKAKKDLPGVFGKHGFDSADFELPRGKSLTSAQSSLWAKSTGHGVEKHPKNSADASARARGHFWAQTHGKPELEDKYTAMFRDHARERNRRNPRAESDFVDAFSSVLHESTAAVQRTCARPILEFSRLRFREAQADTPAGTREVVIIEEGRGNKRDKNYYPPDAVKRSAKVFEGVKCFLDHPSASEERDRPERTVRAIGGWFSDCRDEVIDGKVCAVGRLNFTSNGAGKEAQELVESDVRFQQQNPDGVLIGFSINAEGPSHEVQLDGEWWNEVESIESAMSADLVTFPARGGRVLAFREAVALIDSWRWRESFEAAAKQNWREKFAQMLHVQHAA